MDDLRERRGYWKLKKEILNRNMWGSGLGGVCGPVVRQTTE